LGGAMGCIGRTDASTPKQQHEYELQLEEAMAMPEPEQSGQRTQDSEQSTSESTPQAIERKSSTSLQRASAYDPFSGLRAFSADMNRWFDHFTREFFGPSWLGPGSFPWVDWSDRTSWPTGARNPIFWPELEFQHRGDQLVVQADLPGLQKDDIAVEVRDHDLMISGERRSESEGHEGRYYRSERSYGSFRRSVRLPKGAKPDTASATFENGVLRIEMEAAGGEQAPQGRRIEVREGSLH